jgi:hypothetical protein
MIDITKAKAAAEEGLRIAEFVTPDWCDEAGFNNAGCPTRFFLVPGNNNDAKIEMHAADSEWAVDSRTRAPEAYRNVIALAERVGELEAELERVNGMNLRLGTSFDSARDRWANEQIRLSELVAAAEAAEEKMTRKAEEHYDRAVKAESERDALIAKLASLGAIQ